MQIKILNVNPIETKQGPKKKYKVFTLNYALDQKSQDKNIMEFSPVFAILSKAQPGESYEIESQKNSAGYVDWLSAVLVEANSSGAATGAATAATGAVQKYERAPDPRETPEERAVRQLHIERQSCLNASLKYYEGRFETITPDQVLGLAQVFVNWVGTTVTADDFEDDSIE